MDELRFQAMGTWAHVIVVGSPQDGCQRARARIEDLERRWSRFLPDSEISRLNASDGRVVWVSPETAALVARAARARVFTGGRFDPSVLPALIAAGYDRSIDQIGEATSAPPAAGTGFDPGGIGKGLAADIVVGELLAAGAQGACVNLGGDLRVEGLAPGGGPWVVDVKESPLRLGLTRGAVATSSPLRRRWNVGGEHRHHLIDPATGRPAETDVAAVTVLAGTAWRAEALATAAAVAGCAAGLALIERCRATGLVVDMSGGVHHAAGVASFLG